MAARSCMSAFFTQNLSRLCVRNQQWARTLPCQGFIYEQRCFRSTESSEIEQENVELVAKEVDIEDEAAKRDVSRLPKHLHDQMEHVMHVPEDRSHLYDSFSRQYKRELYAMYGKASGIPAGIMWPSKTELAEIIEDEKEWEPTLQERWAKLEKKRMEEEEEIRKREELVKAQMAKMPEYIEKYRDKLAAKEAVEQEGQAKLKELMEEARDYFGYKLSPRDPRFEQMREEKEAREQLEKKKKRKAQREAKFVEHLKTLKAEAEVEKTAAQKETADAQEATDKSEH